jgi:hypothetical protein
VTTVLARGAIHEATDQELYPSPRPDDSYPYLKAAFASNGRLRPHHALRNGKVLSFPGSTYHLRYNHDGKRVSESVGNDPSVALIALRLRTPELQANALGSIPFLHRTIQP